LQADLTEASAAKFLANSYLADTASGIAEQAGKMLDGLQYAL
jgi:hypothetical protein